MAIKSLIELQKGNLNYTPYANYYDVSNRYNVPQSLSEYILTNYTLGWGNGSARYLSYSNSELDCSYAEQDDITLIPIQRSTITKLAVKFMCTGLNSQWGIFDICLVRFDGNTQINSDRKFFVLDGHIADQSSSNINQWYNYEFDFDNFEADYIGFATGVVGWKLDDFAFYISENANGGGAGSGYIGNSLLSNKKMVGYNVPTSSAEGTKTESVNEVSASAVSGKPKSGNGYVKIKLLKEPNWVTLESILKDTSGLDTHYKKSSVATPSLSVASISDLTSYYGTDWSLKGGTGYGMIYSDREFKNQGQYSSDTWFLPLKKTYKVLGFRGKAKIQDKNSQWDLISIKCDICNGNTIQEVGEGLVLGKVPTEDDSYGTYRFIEVTGNDYNDFSWVLDHFIGATGQYGTDVNYIMLGMATRLEWIKDLECLVIEAG